ncbi:MAG: hypothetical protein MSC31_08135 [Solirubrobacteraceae bacterium MAG38_C4-C5]|nr:hypothetical protein [Candidatus Siliceabacter maunaloa]
MIALLLGPLARVSAFVLLGLLALVGLTVAVGAAVGPATAADLAQLAARDAVDRFLDGLAGGGPAQQTTALIAAGTVVLCLAVAIGALSRRRSRSFLLPDEGDATLGVRPRALRAIAAHLAEGARGVTGARARVRPRRRGPHLRVDATHSAGVEPAALRDDVTSRLASVSEPFGLRARVRPRAGGRGRRAA